jgi:hypothetical protein
MTYMQEMGKNGRLDGSLDTLGVNVSMTANILFAPGSTATAFG